VEKLTIDRHDVRLPNFKVKIEVLRDEKDNILNLRILDDQRDEFVP
jgi:hypothetical protein